MKIAKLNQIFKDFYSNDDRAILIDGSWGIGKTHAILKFLEWTNYEDSGIPDNTVYKYVSLFGKESIDEIHTEIYRQFHPIRYGAKKAVNLIPKVASLGNFLPGAAGSIANTISSLQYALKVTQDSLVKNNEIKHQIVFLDDLERVDFKKISFNQMLGYFDNLIRQGIKIIAICNSEMLLQRYSELKNDFVSFKEKVFDREYKITATHSEIILSYFDDDSQIDEDIISEFKNNLRIAQRVSHFYKEVIEFLAKKKVNSGEFYSNRELLEYCTYVIVETHTSNYKSFNEDNSGDSVFNSHIFYLEQEDKNIEENFKHIYYYRKNKYGYSCTNSKLLTALLQFYFYSDEESLYKIFNLNENNSIFSKSAILLSDEGKRELFAQQIQYVLDGKDLESQNLLNLVVTWFRFSEFSDILRKQNCLLKALIDNIDKYSKQINYLILAVNKTECSDLDKFLLNLDKTLKQKTIDDLLIKIKNEWQNKDYAELLKNISILDDDVLYFTDYKRNKFKPLIEIFIKSNNYFIDELSGEIDIAQWNIALTMTDYAQRYGFGEDLRSYINNLKYVDKSSEYRYKILLEKL